MFKRCSIIDNDYIPILSPRADLLARLYTCHDLINIFLYKNFANFGQIKLKRINITFE